MAVGADQRVGISDDTAAILGGPDGLREVFQIDLMADAGTRRHDTEIGKGVLAPFQEVVAFAVLLVFALDVVAERAALPK